MSDQNHKTTASETKRKLDLVQGASWAFQDGMLRIQLWPQRCDNPFTVWMTPGQALELIEQGAGAIRKAMREQL